MAPARDGGAAASTASNGAFWREAISGATAGMVTTLALQPLDVVKTRLQVQDNVNARRATYRGTIHAFKSIVRAEGARGLYAGLSPAVIGNTVAWSVYFHFYGAAKARWRRRYDDATELPSHAHLAAAAEAGLVVSLITNPIWVVKTRMTLQRRVAADAIPAAAAAAGAGNGAKPYAGFVDALRTIARAEGIGGLYKGITPSLVLVSHGALQFTAYERLKLAATRRDASGSGNATREPSALECAWLGVASKIFASAITYPSQVVRSRMQQRGAGGVESVGGVGGGGGGGGGGGEATPRAYDGFFQSLRRILRREGVFGLYKGMVPNVLRTLPSSGMTFLVYESTKSLLSQ